MRALLIAGDRSGSGKTSITLALAALLAKSMTVQTFKVGMDYIDPSYLTAASGRPCRNLDTFVMNEAEMREIFSFGCQGADLALIEGVRGLYEGSDPVGDQGSTAAVAKLFDLPVVLVVNARSITRSAAAVVKGFQVLDPAIRIVGVILNQVSGERHAEKATTAISHYCDLPVLGAIPRTDDISLTMRHLGLVPFREGAVQKGFQDQFASVTGMVGEAVDPDAVAALAVDVIPQSPLPGVFSRGRKPDVTVGIALDEAFNFYYADLFDIFPALGASLLPFSPLSDSLPDADGYILGGGYPELFLPALEGNDQAREAIREASAGGTPIYAECGGLMYLTDTLSVARGFAGTDYTREFQMCGAIPGRTEIPSRRIVRYVTGDALSVCPFWQGPVRGHEFHYSAISLDATARFAYRLTRGEGIRDRNDGVVMHRTLGSYTHLHPVSSREFFRGFVEACRTGGKV
ncbi:MAG: Ni-sirohydrochlorin a,c-diamide synthase [Methanomicrobiales archaeon]|nr:Ni-sirohydrochlorin a,c-diamide synthase [Methanomicrobiales archaeon]